MAFQSNSKRKLGKEDKQNRLLNNLWQVVDANPGHYSLPPDDEKPCKLVDHICGKDLQLYTNGMQRIKDHSEIRIIKANQGSQQRKCSKGCNASGWDPAIVVLMPELEQESTE